MFALTHSCVRADLVLLFGGDLVIEDVISHSCDDVLCLEMPMQLRVATAAAAGDAGEEGDDSAEWLWIQSIAETITQQLLARVIARS